VESIDYDKGRLAGLTALAFVLTVGLPYLLFEQALSGLAGRYFLAPALTVLTYLIVWRSISILLSNWRAITMDGQGITVTLPWRSCQLRWGHLEDASIETPALPGFRCPFSLFAILAACRG